MKEIEERAYCQREIEVSFGSSGWHGDFEKEREREEKRKESEVKKLKNRTLEMNVSVSFFILFLNGRCMYVIF